MSTFNLWNSAKSYFNHELINKAAANLGESESGISKAIAALIPAVIAAIANKASTTDGAHTIGNLAAGEYKDGILDTISGFLHHESSSSLISKSSSVISSVFGNTGDSNRLTAGVANYAGIKSSSAGTLLSMALPLMLGLLGRHVADNNINAAGLSSLVGAQKILSDNAAPSGFAFGNDHSSADLHSANEAHNTNKDQYKNSFLGWLVPLILLALLAVGAYYMFSKGGDSNMSEHPVTVVESPGNHSAAGNVSENTKGVLDTASGDFIYNAGELIALTLPNNAGALTAGKNSTEAKLIAFLENKNELIDTVKGNWFEFTNVHFKTGSAELTDASFDQLKNMVAISKAYPAAKFKFGGYTDSTGNALSNIALSQKRADAVHAMAIKFGADAASLETSKGYGKEWPIANNATAEGRAINRRVAVNVKAK